MLIGIAAGTALPMAQSPADSPPSVSGIVLPTRTSPSSSRAIEPPTVPSNAGALPPLAFTLTTVWKQPGHQLRRTVQKVVRTSDRVQLSLDGMQKEWVLLRNPVHPARVSGCLIDHASRRILVYDDSDLRNHQQLRGWADVLLMRFDPDVLPRLRRTGETEMAAGTVFTRYVTSDDAASGVVDVWWSDDVLLPLRLTTRDPVARITTSITQLTRSVDTTRLREPGVRFPDYGVVDVSDARDHRA